MGAEPGEHRFALSPPMGGLWALLAAWAFYSVRIPLGLLETEWRLAGSLLATVIVVGAVVALLELLYPSPSNRWFAAAARQDQVPSVSRAVRACCVGLAIYPVASGVRSLTEQAVPTAPEVLRARAEFLETTPAALLLITVVLLGPMLEELLYRSALWRRLYAGGGALASFFICTLGFALAHGQPTEWPALLLVGLVLGMLRHCTGRWADSWLAHASFNAVTVGSSMLSGVATEVPALAMTPFLVGLFLSGALAVACCKTREPSA